MGMGAADVVPGVSGGTIAFIVGIYEELIDSIKSINGASLKLLLPEKSRHSGKQSMPTSCYPSLQGSGSVSSRWQKSSPGCWQTTLFWSGPSSSDWYLLPPGSFQRYQEMGLENDPELYHQDRYCILHNGCDTSRDTFQPVLYLPLRSDSHLCHDPAGYIG